MLSSMRRGRHAPWLDDDTPIPLLALAQLRRQDVPDLAGPEGRDLLQVFWCPFDAHGPGRDVAVHLNWESSEEVGEVLSDQPEPEVVGNSNYVPEPCVIHPEQVWEHQDEGLLPAHLLKSIRKWEARQRNESPNYQFDLSIPPGWKVGGFASWNLTDPAPMTCECGSEMNPLLTIDSQEWDDGSISWAPVEEQDILHARGANTPTQVVVGRSGSLRLFTCPVDVSHPHRMSIQ